MHPQTFPNPAKTTHKNLEGVRIKKAIFYIGGGLLLLDLVVFVLRVASVWRVGDLFQTSGGEGLPLYGIWRVFSGHSLYTPPFELPYVVLVYNYFFYWFYGLVARGFGIDPTNLIGFSRAISAACGLLGALLTYRFVYRVVAAREARGWCGMGSLFLWLHTYPLSWFLLSARPDVLSLTFMMGGLGATYDILKQPKLRTCLIAAVLFYLSWATRQASIAWLLASLGVMVLSRVPLRFVVCLGGAWGAMVGATLLIGGTTYIENMISAGKIYPYVLNVLVSNLTMFLIVLPLLLATAYLAYSWIRNARTQEPWQLLLLVTIACSFLIDCFTGGKSEASKNHFFQTYFAMGLLGVILSARGLSSNYGRKATLGAIVFFYAQPVALLGSLPGAGKLTLTSDSDYRALAAWKPVLDNQPQPLLVHLGMLSLPWHSGNPELPTFLLDSGGFYDGAKRHGFIMKSPLGVYLSDRKPQSIVLMRDSRLETEIRGAGFCKLPNTGPNQLANLFVPCR